MHLISRQPESDLFSAQALKISQAAKTGKKP